MNVALLDSADWSEVLSTGVERTEIESCLSMACDEVAALLDVSKHLNVMCRPGTHGVIAEYGVGGYTYDTELISVTFDPSLPHVKEALLNGIRWTVFHEANHAYRWLHTEYDEHLLNSVVFEGLATVFERDYAPYRPLYGEYDEAKTQEWVKLLNRPDMADYDKYFFMDDSGNRWMGYKTGAWIVDRAMAKSDKTVIELTPMSYKDIMKLAEVEL